MRVKNRPFLTMLDPDFAKEVQSMQEALLIEQYLGGDLEKGVNLEYSLEEMEIKAPSSNTQMYRKYDPEMKIWAGSSVFTNFLITSGTRYWPTPITGRPRF